MKSPSSIHVASEIVRRGAKLNPPRFFTPMQLLKLVYICHGWMLGLYGRPMISDPIEAWMYGPVIPDLYQHVKSFRDQPVTLKAIDAAPDGIFDKYQNHMIEEVIKKYSHLSGPALSRITHAPGTPWSLSYSKTKTNRISNDMIADHYQILAVKREADADAARNAT